MIVNSRIYLQQVQYTCISQSTLMSSSDLLFCLLDCNVHKLYGYYCK